MAGFSDALRGYALAVHRRDGFRCRYCGLDGTAAFGNWPVLSWDHLLPTGHLHRDDPEFIVTACISATPPITATSTSPSGEASTSMGSRRTN